MVGVAKKKEDPTKKKGELMESNMDAMEVCISTITQALHFDKKTMNLVV